jgi:hypothetical protein
LSHWCLTGFLLVLNPSITDGAPSHNLNYE